VYSFVTPTETDRNAYWPGGFRDPKMVSNNTAYDTVAAYFTAVRPGIEANSLVVNPLLTDPANGDFTSGQAGLPANCGLERPNITYTPIPASAAAAEAWILGA
jgi:hypothetical protein